MIETHTPGFVGIFALADKRKLLQKENLEITEDSSGLYIRANSMDELTRLHSELGLTPLQIRPANLEDVFLKLTGKEITLDA